MSVQFIRFPINASNTELDRVATDITAMERDGWTLWTSATNETTCLMLFRKPTANVGDMLTDVLKAQGKIPVSIEALDAIDKEFDKFGKLGKLGKFDGATIQRWQFENLFPDRASNPWNKTMTPPADDGEDIDPHDAKERDNGR